MKFTINDSRWDTKSFDRHYKDVLTNNNYVLNKQNKDDDHYVIELNSLEELVKISKLVKYRIIIDGDLEKPNIMIYDDYIE